MTILYAFFAAVLLVSGTPTPADPSTSTRRIEALAWLGGCWAETRGVRTTFEMWSPPSGGLMVGAGRTVAGGQARAFEHLRILATDEGLVYTALPSGQAETHFRSTSFDENGFVVENPEHDFPQLIAYTRTGPDAFTARVEGRGDEGVMAFEIAYQRVSCTATGAEVGVEARLGAEVPSRGDSPVFR